MTEVDVDAVVALVSAGSGVEAALKKLAIDSTIGTEALKAHRNARTRLKDAKVLGAEVLRAAALAKAQAAQALKS